MRRSAMGGHSCAVVGDEEESLYACGSVRCKGQERTDAATIIILHAAMRSREGRIDMRLLVCLGLALLLSGCSDNGPLSATGDADVSGTWQGPIAFAGQRATLRLSIFQNRFDLSGNWVIGDNGGSLGGQVSGTAVLLTLRDATPCQVNVTASVTESKMTGSFALSTTGCGGDTTGGSVDLTKVR